MATKRERRLVSFTIDELSKVKADAKRLGLDLSEYLRRLALGHRLPDPLNFEKADCIMDLHKLNADQARLGNLLKLILDQLEDEFDAAGIQKIEALIDEVNTTREAFKQAARQLHYEMHPRRYVTKAN